MKVYRRPLYHASIPLGWRALFSDKRINSRLFGAARYHTAGGGAHPVEPYPPSAPPPLRQALPPRPSDTPETSFLKCIEKEILDEQCRLDKQDGPPSPPPGWEFSHAAGTSVVYGRRVWVPPPSEAHAGLPRTAEKHFIRAQLTTRDPSLDPECDIRGEHFPFSLFVKRCEDSAEGFEAVERVTSPSSTAAPADPFRDDEMDVYSDSIEVRCDLVDGELRVERVLVHGEVALGDTRQRLPCRPTGDTDESRERLRWVSLFDGYAGPSLDEAEEDVLDGLQAWLAARCVDDLLGEFIGAYTTWVEQLEYERWLQHLRDYVAA